MATNLAKKIYEIDYGNTCLEFQLNFADRKTLAIHVYPDSSIMVDAPQNSKIEKIKAKILKRAKWIRKQQYLFNRYPPALPARKYVSGESFRYLGKQYVLKIERALISQVKLNPGKLVVYAPYINRTYIKGCVDAWFRKKAEIVFQERLDFCLILAKRMGISYSNKIILRTMKMRWGSCSKDRKITLNPELISASKECIDYVIIHELCHLKEYNHGPAFYKLLSIILPDWNKRKEKLEATMEARLI